MENWEAMEATGTMVEPKRVDAEWGRALVYLLRMHPVGITEKGQSKFSSAVLRMR